MNKSDKRLMWTIVVVSLVVFSVFAGLLAVSFFEIAEMQRGL